MAESGPTQGAERHADAIERWKSRPWLARTLRVAIAVAPLILSIGYTVTVGRVLPPERLGVHRWVWIGLVFVTANLLLFGLTRLTRRLMPLVALMKLTLVFPDNAPSRTRSALRSSNSRTMLRQMEQSRARGDVTGETIHGDYLVQLLKEVNEHDRLTRGHSERVRAYSELLGEQIGLDDDDMHKLRWASLLHDVGKLTVPSEILNKDGRPTDDEWTVLSGHPGAGLPMLEPLRPWLGDWIHAADEHHCRWDGNGYPKKVGGTEITLAGRLVAIADAYDVMTSARSYKKPLAPELARQELTDCAGSQFDPTLVKAFLRIGLDRLKTVAGPLAWIANLTGSAQIPVPATSAVTNAAVSSGTAAVAVATAAVGGFLPVGAPPPVDLAFADPAIVVEDLDLTVESGAELTVALRADGGLGQVTFTWTDPVHGTVIAGPDGGTATRDADQRSVVSVTYVPDAGRIGRDDFVVEGCDAAGDCDDAVVSIDVRPGAIPVAEPQAQDAASAAPTPVPDPTATATPDATPTPLPTPTPIQPPVADPPVVPPPPPPPPPPVVDEQVDLVADGATVAEDSSSLIAVLDNDRDPEGADVTLFSVTDPDHGTAEVVGNRVRYTPRPDFSGEDRFTYRAGDGTSPSRTASVLVTVTPVNDPPVASVARRSIPESSPVGTTVTTVEASDADGTIPTISIIGGNGAGRFAVASDGIVTVAGPLDHETTESYLLRYRVDDGAEPVVVSATVTITDVDERPVALADGATTVEDTPTTIAIGANDADPEGRALAWDVPSVSASGATLADADGTVTYTPPAGWSGVDSFSYTATDPALLRSDPATVVVTVTPVNDAPVAGDDSGLGFVTTEDTGVHDRRCDGERQ